ncbi:Glyoxalase/bleomycin resistance protein/dioxygenase [Nocardioides sp. JS614]|uniref:Glyoxalase/bleomycin resistance protein/dioxygenase n=1 Tax=Nocardioides sp. (strain ATCC BAA-499 / JS614) TaxID=196162 RepID=A0ACD6B8E0_NOCSJ|nr:Glyoxalase/bleomycin resistance protein/dioxygenase [Nocardioides sp. JS614]
MTVSRPTITDLCLVTHDLEASVEFYTTKLGYTLSSRMPGFADFEGPGVILALWDAQLIRETTGVPALAEEPSGRTVMVAVELSSPVEIDTAYERLRARGIEFYSPPADYPWNARCIYFPGPCGEFWEYFAWLEGGKPGQLGAASTTHDERTIP